MNLREHLRVKVIFQFVSFLQFSTVPLGSIAELPAETCHEIKNSEGEAPSGNYWLSVINSSMPVLTYCNLEGKISTKYLASILTNVLSLRSLGMGISTLFGARWGQFGRNREKYRDCRNIIVARVQEAFFYFASHHSSFNKLRFFKKQKQNKTKHGCVYTNIFFGFAMPKKVKTFCLLPN